MNLPRTLDQRDEFIFTQFFTGGTSTAIDNRRNVLALRAARAIGREAEVRTIILARRRQHLVWLTLVQRDWQTKVSRRPQRGRHHDSWGIREKCVRCV